ncbi:hypothetical protein DFH06DRAFT_1210941 [Mycena polygramma]|nr:hypothetical protein DFH06DRAFT_1210941 [Mycena polygramma]
MSVEDLRARIAKLSAEIDLQKELLNRLEHDKSLAQRQLNAAVDPMARLPVEISSEIFLQSLPPTPKPGVAQPLLLLRICHAWTDIALSTPDLWTGVHITSPCADGGKDGLSIWLRRAHNYPLSISLRFRGSRIDPDVAHVIWSEDRQLKHLEIRAQGKENPGIDSDVEMIDFFSGNVPGPLLLLETLLIRGPKKLEEWVTGSGLQILELLRLAPNLSEFVLEHMVSMASIPSTTEMVVLPTLRRLVFGERGTNPDSNDGVFNYLSLPALEVLSLSLTATSTGGFFSFLERSSPPLQELILGDGLRDHVFRTGFALLADSLRLVPTLTRLELWGPSPRTTTGLFTAMTESLSLLPNLHTLALYPYDWSGIPYPAWKKLLKAFLIRRTTLRTLYVELSGSPQPAADILAGFRALQAEGMQIHISGQYCQY